ncbi:MAG TPA: SRPBCC domain-containing protein [Candidatus Bathyarchaeia archaeon]|nr:SRPBCC domain-containing protein [Candidatus Bathyarchaeia archaeon]
MDLRFTVQTKIQKPVSEVFDAVYNPRKLSTYFTSGGSSGPLDEGKTVMWKFNDMGAKVETVPVKVKKVVKNKLIEFSWGASEGVYDPKTGSVPQSGGYDTVVEMSFEPLNANETLVKIVEGKWRSSTEGLQGSYGNCQGWTQMTDCLKAYLEYGINLRKGSY